MSEPIRYSAGLVTAYGAAVRGGYQGSYEQWCQDMANLGDNVAEVRQKAAQVEQTAEVFTEQTVPAAIQSVADAGADQVQAVENAGANATSDIGTAKTAAITALQAESTTQQAAIQQKGEDTIESIPSDYTALTEEVDDLNSAFEIENLSKLTTEYRIKKGCIDASTGTWKSVTSANILHAIIPVKPGAKVSIVSNGIRAAGFAALKTYNPVLDQIADFSAESPWTGVVGAGTSTAVGSFYGNFPSDASYLYVYLGNTDYNRMPAKLIVDGYDYLASAVENVQISASQRTKIRLMQNNVGHFNFGQSISGNRQYLNTANYQNKLNAYKKLYGAIQPDVLGLEEFEVKRWVYVDDGTVTPTVQDKEIDMDNEIFNFLYPHQYLYWGLSSAPCLKSKYPIIDTSRGNYEYTYTYNGIENTANQRVLYSHINIDGKIIAVIVAGFPSGAGDEKMQMRKGSIAGAINLLKNDEYAFIICDENNAGVAADTKIDNSVAEGNAIYTDVLAPNHFASAMGSFFPWAQSWQSTIMIGNVTAVDNIFYKDNGRTMLSNMDVLQSEYDNLLSDHYPLYADFILL